jgi:hypothetical protein
MHWGRFRRKFWAKCADKWGVFSCLNNFLDYLVRQFGRIPGFATFGFFFGAAVMLPCTYLGLIDGRQALIEVGMATIWMAAASVVLSIFSRGEEE